MSTPHAWRIGFRIAERSAAKHGSPLQAKARVRPGKFPQHKNNAAPLAKRFEALLRVFDAPESYIKRAARVMRRKPEALAAMCADNDDELAEKVAPNAAMLRAAESRAVRRDTS